MWSIVALINPFITNNSSGIVKLTKKTNPPRLETKKGELYPYTFRCSNCKGNHQANLNKCFFWQHRFNREWHSKEYAKICKSWKQSICLTIDSIKAWLLWISKSFHRMFGKTIWLLTQSLRQHMTSILYLFKSLPKQPFTQYQVQVIVKVMNWLEYLII